MKLHENNKIIIVPVVFFIGIMLLLLVSHGKAKDAQRKARTANSRRWVLPHLAIGSLAPDIDASDLFGQKMKLSGYRIKVVLLVFWYSMCAPCMGDVPHEKALVKRFAGRPFTLVGVNCDYSTAETLAAVEKLSMLWKSFWNGESGCAGRITRLIQHANLRGDAIDTPLDQMIASAETRGHEKENPNARPGGEQKPPNAAVKGLGSPTIRRTGMVLLKTNHRRFGPVKPLILLTVLASLGFAKWYQESWVRVVRRFSAESKAQPHEIDRRANCCVKKSFDQLGASVRLFLVP